jgi:MFS family permease
VQRSVALPRPGLVLWRRSGLWLTEFPKFWAGQTVSVLGSQVTLLALPLIFVALNASAAEMGILRALQYLPYLLFGLPAGAWVDRVARRPLLLTADLGRAGLIFSVPLAAAFGMLHTEHVLFVAFAAGTLTVVFDVAQQAFVPSLVKRDYLTTANEQLEASRSLGLTLGPAIGGPIVQIVGAPFALLLDAASFLISAATLQAVRSVPETVAPPPQRNLRAEILEGVRIVARNPLLRSMCGCAATLNLCNNALFAVLLLYLSRDLHLAAPTIGLVLAALGPGGIIGAMLAGRIARIVGIGPTIVGSVVAAGLGFVLVLPAGPDQPALLPLVALSLFVSGVSSPIYNVNTTSLRQAITPDRLRGRVMGSMRMVSWGSMPIGALLGGVLGEWLGVREAVALSAVGMGLAALWLIFSPIARLRQLPAPLEA